MGEEFYCIDFETANSSRGSVCALGLVKADSRRILEEHYTLVRPRHMHFDGINVSIHGITEDDVRDKPQFNKLWPDFRNKLHGSTLVAHNASFDISVLRHVLAEYGLEFPSLRYSCTLVASRATWPDLVSYRLDSLAEYLGFSFRHHHALEDARICAKVMQRILDEQGAKTVDELPTLMPIVHGRLFPGGYEPCAGRPKRTRKKLRSQATALR